MGEVNRVVKEAGVGEDDGLEDIGKGKGFGDFVGKVGAGEGMEGVKELEKGGLVRTGRERGMLRRQRTELEVEAERGGIDDSRDQSRSRERHRHRSRSGDRHRRRHRDEDQEGGRALSKSSRRKKGPEISKQKYGQAEREDRPWRGPWRTRRLL